MILPLQLSCPFSAREPPLIVTSPVIVVLTASAIELPFARVKLPPARLTLPVVAVKPPFDVLSSIVKLAFEPSTVISPVQVSSLLIVTVPFSPIASVVPEFTFTVTASLMDDAPVVASAPATDKVPLFISKVPLVAISCPLVSRPS